MVKTEIGAKICSRRGFSFQMIFLPKIFCRGSTAVVVLSKVISSSNCGNDASKEVEADVVMWLDPKEPVKLGSPGLPCKQACCGVSLLWLFRFGYIPNESQMAWAYDFKYITVAGFEGEVAGKF